MSTAHSFSKRFAGPWSDKVLRSRIAVRVEPLKGLADIGPVEASSRLEARLKTVVVPTAQMIAVVRQLIERAKAYCDRAYPNTVAVRTLMYGSSPAPANENCQATCITGLAGVGKSVLFDAFCRVFGTSEFVEMPGHARLELHACWRMTIRGRAGFTQLVHPHFRDQTEVSPSRILEGAVSEAAAQGIALILPDEFQFITSGSANTMMANLLFRLAQVGPPVIYACNYSMLHSLWRRPQQDRDRLLLNPIILHPEQLGEDWKATVEGCLEVAEEFSLLNNESDIRLLHDYTYGIKRSLRSILVLAYLQMRKDKQTQVTKAHLTAAYRSFEYSAMREDVENLVQGAVTTSLLRKDLACPFGSADLAPPANNVVDHPAARIHTANATHAALLSMQTPEMRQLLAALDDQALPQKITKSQPSRRPPASPENLLGGAERFASHEKKDA
jgi:hypothetical protein